MTTQTRIALVTGAAQGIGKAIALRLADDGFDLALNDIASQTESLESVKAAVNEKGQKAIVLAGDVSLEEDMQVVFDRLVEELGGVDVVVANAGVTAACPFTALTVSEWDRVFNINTRGTFLTFKIAAIQMIKQGRGGRIIGACSSSGKQGIPMLAHYSASKFAIRGLTQAAARELGQHKITVNSYAPSTVQTPMIDNFLSEVGAPKEAFYTTQDKETALGYHGQPEYIADLVSFLASEKSHHITGQTINIDGGKLFD